jgi:aerobic carbon-monoxide dehydrogenase small subunit
VAAEGLDVRTLEGMADDALMRTIKDSFHEKHGLQCGFCTPGMLMSSWDLIKRRGSVSEREIRVAMSGNLCRCTGYQNIVRSIKAAAEAWASKGDVRG